jgi:hypothetical protein
MCVNLNVLLEDIPSEETEGQSSLAGFNEVQVDCIDDLLGRNKDICSGSLVMDPKLRIGDSSY